MKRLTFLIFMLVGMNAMASSAEVNQLMLTGEEPKVNEYVDIARKMAPIFTADKFRRDNVNVEPYACKFNIPTAVDFDGNWEPLDNEASYYAMLDLGMQAEANIYYEAVVSETHIFLTYYLFYPHDAGDGCQFEKPTDNGGHLNDASSVMIIVRNDAGDPKVEWVLSMDSGYLEKRSSREILSHEGRPVISVSNGNHTMRFLSFNEEMPGPEKNYRFGLEDDVKFSQIFNSIWEHKGNGALFCMFSRGMGVRFCDEKDKTVGRGTPPWAPWARDFMMDTRSQGYYRQPNIDYNLGTVSYFDPIYAFQPLYTEDAKVYSTTYLYNPYRR